jgi:CRISPR system Cascade subunit CasB
MSGFIDWLERLNEKDTKVRAVLRRSLAFEPGSYVPAFPYVEPRVKDEDGRWRREMLYLVAGLWAAHWRQDRVGQPMSIGEACATYDAEKRNKVPKDEQRQGSSTERRLVTLLDSDIDQLPHRLRQMISLLKDQPIDFEALLKGLLYWNDERKRTQNAWARDFYRNTIADIEEESVPQEEVTT